MSERVTKVEVDCCLAGTDRSNSEDGYATITHDGAVVFLRHWLPKLPDSGRAELDLTPNAAVALGVELIRMGRAIGGERT